MAREVLVKTKTIKFFILFLLFFAPVISYRQVHANSVLASNSLIQSTPSSSSYQWTLYQNNIFFYNPCGGVSGNYTGSCGGEIVGTGNSERLRDLTRKYGILAMNLQITYGISWEFLLAQTAAESGVGTAGTAARQAADGRFNWMGLSTCVEKGSARYGNGVTYPRPASEKCWYESYDSIELMMKSYASGDYFRNGGYDYALSFTDKDNYDMVMFARAAFARYVDGSPQGTLKDEDDFYVQTTLEYIEKDIRPVAKEMGWPTSSELQRQKNIPVGGKFPLGTPREEAYDDTVSCGSVNSTSSASSSSDNVSGSDITWIGDSNSTVAREVIESRFPGISFGGKVNTENSYIQGCKFVSKDTDCNGPNPSAFKVLQRIIDAGNLKPYLVMAVGDNGSWSEADVKQFKEIMSNHSNTKVILVNSRTKASSYEENNKLLKKLADSEMNYYLADWASAYDEKYYEEDDAHFFSNGGSEKWVGVIAEAIVNSNNDNCGGKNPVVTVDGYNYMFPLAGASKSNYLHPDGRNGYSALSHMPCLYDSIGACHHDHIALDLGIRANNDDSMMSKYPDLNNSYSKEMYYSTGVKALAFVKGKITQYVPYDRAEDGYQSKCASITYEGEDGLSYWIGHLSYDDKIKTKADSGTTFELGDVLGEVGPPPCAIGTQAHIHINISPQSDNNPKIITIINKTYEALPETTTGSGKECAINSNSICNYPETDEDKKTSNSNNILQAVQDIIDLANKNGSTYSNSGHDLDTFKKFLAGESRLVTDCSGFASLVYYKAYGSAFRQEDIFTSRSLYGGDHASYKQVSASDVQPGDIFAWNGHAGIVYSVKDGKVTKIIEVNSGNYGGTKNGFGELNQSIRFQGNGTDPYSRFYDKNNKHYRGDDVRYYRWKGSA